jgi:tetratricopeptide (TPR) repeat protein
LVPVKVNAEEEGVELAQKYGVTGYPTIVFVDAEGEKIGTSVGFMPKEDFLPVITMATKVMERVPELKRTLATNPTVEAHLEMMEIAEFKTDWTLAAEHLTGAVALGHETENLSERYFLFGDNLVRASEFEKSLEIFDEALSHATADIDRAFALAGMAYANANLGNDEKATEYAAQILEIESDDPQIESLHEFAKQYVDES